jgi:hypothetical protein
MSAVGVLIQAMAWLGWPEPSALQLFIYFLTVGMFGITELRKN